MRMFSVDRTRVNRRGRLRLTIGHYLTTVERLWQPPRCVFCGAPGGLVFGMPLDLCEPCKASLPSDVSAAPRSLARSAWVLSPYAYAHPVDHLVRSLKFRGELAPARIAGLLLAEARSQCEERQLPHAIVPVPLHPTRLRLRGFNQSLAIAHFAGRALNIPVDSRVLERCVLTAEQSRLSAELRRKNVTGAFGIRHASVPRSVALIDDVMTTGSTLRAALEVLVGAGCERVEIWTFARA